VLAAAAGYRISLFADRFDAALRQQPTNFSSKTIDARRADGYALLHIRSGGTHERDPGTSQNLDCCVVAVIALCAVGAYTDRGEHLVINLRMAVAGPALLFVLGYALMWIACALKGEQPAKT
jgi:hypothetical protein